MYDKPATLFFPEKPEVKGYVNCTYKDLNKDYKTNTEIKVDGFSNLITKGSEEIIAGYLISQGIVPGLLFLIGVEAMSSFFQYLDSKSIEALYNKLKNHDYIDKEYINQVSGSKNDKKIKGYITDKVAHEVGIKFELDTGEKIKVKLEDGIFIWHQKIGGADVRIPNSLRQDENKVTFLTHGPNYELKKNNDVYELTSVIYSKESKYLLKSSYPDLNFKEFYDNSYKYAVPNRPNLVYGKADFDNSFIKHRGKLILNILKIISQLQQSYLSKQSQNQYLVLNPEAESEGEKVKIFTVLPEKDEKETSNGTTATYNEYSFMPYIAKDGNINKTKPQLRDEYIASVFKSMLQKHKEITEHGKYKSMSVLTADTGVPTSKPVTTAKDEISPVKYGLEEYENKYWHDFVNVCEDFINNQVQLDEKFLQTIRKVKCRVIENPYNHSNLKTTVFFNYHKIILEKIQSNPQLLENYYEIEEKSSYQQDKVIAHPESKQATHVITIHPNYKSQLEYKYNPTDEIIGGDLKLYVKVEEETKDDIAETLAQQKKDQSQKSKSQQSEEDKVTAEAEQTAPSSELKDKLKLFRGLDKTSKPEEIKVAAEIVINVARKREKEIIAEMLEDYLAGRYRKKKVKPEKLRTLECVKEAEVELRLKIERKLVSKLNRIIDSPYGFKPGEIIRFKLRESRLIHPIRKMEDFFNPSQESRLRAEAEFELRKVVNRRKLDLKGKLTYSWENEYRWRVGRKKLVPGYGFIDDYLFKKLAADRTARPYKMYADWNYYLEDSISLIAEEVDCLKYWHWTDMSFCTYI
ncbi:MAG: hypothetical protein ACQERJ_07380 [Bacillota bacterium]